MNLSEKLGYPKESKLVLIHADDAGLSHSENRATIKALENGMVSSYSVMVPCPWFYQMAEYASKNPQFDHGVHLTLTCEWDSYKFGPVLSSKEVPSLVDEHGYFFKDRQQVIDNATLEDLNKEIKAQIERAYVLGLQPSHLDSHMYSLGAKPEFLQLYRDIGKEYRLPVMLNNELIENFSGLNVDQIPQGSEIFVDTVYLGQYDLFKNDKLSSYYEESLLNLKVGFNLVLIHPAFEDAEMKSVTINHPNFGAAWRQIDLDFFTSDRCKKILSADDIHLISWNEIKEIMYPAP